MSVRSNQYILAGVKLPYDIDYDVIESYIDNRYSDEIKHHKDLAVVSDGMNGQYIFIGRILHKSQVNELIDGPIDVYELDPDSKEKLATLINDQFPGRHVNPIDIKTWFVTHYG